jgi:hypothetical protein
VGHINNKVGTNEVGNLAHAGIIDQSAVGGCTSNKDLWSVHQSILLKLIIIDDTGLEVDPVWEGFEVGRDRRDPSFG